MKLIVTICIAAIITMTLLPVAHAQQTGIPVYGSTNPADFIKYDARTQCHGGRGTLPLGTILSGDIFKTRIHAVSRGIIPPKSSIGEHVHRKMEEIFIVLNTTAEFTIDGKTSLLPAGSMVVCNKYHTHGIYNPHDDIDLDWLYFAVTDVKGQGEAVDFGEDLTNKQLESPVPFKYTVLDRTLLRPADRAHGGKGTIFARRLWDSTDFKTDWAFIDHVVLPPGTSFGYHQHTMLEEVDYIVSGTGYVTVNDHTWTVGPGDAIPCTLHDTHGLYNSGTEDLVLIVSTCEVEKGARVGSRDTIDRGDDLVDRTPTN
jgi:mannose-6-phosphate isomerase-like protein (cupin superfamily)